MGMLYLVRHGQASFGADDYDQLSPLGVRQSIRLGEYFRELGLEWDAVITGTLRRHEQTWEGVARGMGCTVEPLKWPGLNEYDSAALIDTLHASPSDPPTTPEGYRQHFRLLKDALRQWMAGVVSPRGMPTYDAFVEGVISSLEHVRARHEGHVLLVTSGGPISTAVGHLLGTSPETTIELNMRLRNTSITELQYNVKRHTLISFNALPHLAQPPYQAWITHA